MNGNRNQNNLFTCQIQETFKNLIDKHLHRYIPKKNSGSELYEHYSDKKFEWCILTNAFNGHDECWTEYESVTIQFFENEGCVNTDFVKKDSEGNIRDTIFSSLINDIEKHSKAVYFRNNGSHYENIKKETYTFRYYYYYDIEYIFKSPYNYDTDIHLRCSMYDNRK